jgi:hypothetical protein
VTDLAPLLALAEKDAQEPKAIVPYLTISIAGDPLNATAKTNELPQLRAHALDVVTSNR